MRLHSRLVFVAALAFGPLPAAVGQTPFLLTDSSTPYTQNFNALRPGGGDTVPGVINRVDMPPYTGTNPNTALLGWRHRTTASSPAMFTASDGGLANLRAYSYGTDAADRAFGMISGQTSLTTHTGHLFGFLIRNDTGAPIDSVTVNYTGEQWRSGFNLPGLIDRLDFGYAKGTGLGVDITSSVTDVNELDFTSPNPDAAGGALNGNASENRTAKSFTITLPGGWQPGETLAIRWADFDIPDEVDDGMAVDEVTISFGAPVPEPTGVLAVCGAVTAIGAWVRRRTRRTSKPAA